MSEALLQLENSHCMAFAGLPTEQTVRLTVSYGTGADQQTRLDAATLFDALAAALPVLGGRHVVPACRGRYRGSGGCMADQGAAREHNVLIVVEDPRADIDVDTTGGFQQFPSHFILPVSRWGGRATPSPSIAQNIMLTYTPGSISDLVPDVLEAAGLGVDRFRLFISYRHDQSEQVANQLFHAFAEARFAVFLDRFRGQPGEDFVGRIMAELFDKSCVLVLEGPQTHASPWVQAEVATAWAHRLGLLAVDLPGSPGALLARTRLDLTTANGGTPLGQHGALIAPEIGRIVEFVRQHIALEGARRRRWQARLLEAAVQNAAVWGLEDYGQVDGGRHVRGGSVDYHIRLEPRPPSAASFKQSADVANGRRAVLTAPLAYQLPQAAGLTEWLAQVSPARTLDEGELARGLRNAARGQL